MSGVLEDPHSTLSELRDQPRLSRRRQFIDRLHRISSSPSLSKLHKAPHRLDRYRTKYSASCVSLNGDAGPSNGLRSDVRPASAMGAVQHLAVQTATAAAASIVVAPQPLRVAHTPGDIVTLHHQRQELALRHKLAEQHVQEAISECFAEVPAEKLPLTFTGSLPDEIKMEIMSYLKPKELIRCSIVSKSWYKMCFDGQLWQTIDTQNYYRTIPANQLARLIISSGPFVQHLVLRGCVQLHNYWHKSAVSSACNNLVSANLEGSKLDGSDIHYLVQRNSHLVHLNLAGLSAMNNIFCRNVAQGCPRLESLNVSWCNNMDAMGIKAILNSCKNLKELRANETRHWDRACVAEALFHAEALERLQLAGCDSLTDECIQVFVDGISNEIDIFTNRTECPPRKLKQLDLSRCVNLTDSTLEHLATRVPELLGLELSGASGLTDVGFEALLPTLPKLTHLDIEEISGLTDQTMLNLSKAPCAARLEHLQVSYCEQLQDRGMIEVIQNCTSLKSLEVDNTRVGDLFLKETADAVKARSQSTDRPEIALRLAVYDCQNITWVGVRDILNYNSSSAVVLPNSSPIPQVHGIIKLKCFYLYQMTVDEVTKRVLRGNLSSARKMTKRWEEYQLAAEQEAGQNGGASAARRRRRRRASILGAEDEGGHGTRRRRGGCTIM